MPEVRLGQPPLDTRPWKPFSRSQSDKANEKSRTKPWAKSRSGRDLGAATSPKIEPLQASAAEADAPGSEGAAETNVDRCGGIPLVQQRQGDAERRGQKIDRKRAKEAERSGRRRTEEGEDGRCSSCAIM